MQPFRRCRFRACGTGVAIGPGCSIHYEKISVGNNVFIGERAMFHASIAGIQIGSKVMFGPAVTILGGDHRFDAIGQHMWDVTDKRTENDQLVIIEDDVWIGAHAIILKGVRIGTGSVIGAGSVVTRDVPPYSVYTGAPSQRIRPRWNEDEITRHIDILERK